MRYWNDFDSNVQILHIGTIKVRGNIVSLSPPILIPPVAEFIQDLDQRVAPLGQGVFDFRRDLGIDGVYGGIVYCILA